MLKKSLRIVFASEIYCADKNFPKIVDKLLKIAPEWILKVQILQIFNELNLKRPKNLIIVKRN